MADMQDSNPSAHLPLRARALQWANRALPDSIKRRIPARLKHGLAERLIDVAGAHRIALGEKSRFEYPASDHYWVLNAQHIRAYEPEMWWALDRYLDANSMFIDCGANFGLWSSYAAERIGNPAQVLAVEPGEGALPQLTRNQQLNGSGFTIVPAAIWEKAGETVEFSVCKNHVSSCISGLELNEKHSLLHKVRVPTVSIDALAEQANADMKIVVKLDVEGAEITALNGAKATLAERQSLVIYEDHAGDADSKVTTHLLDAMGFHVYHVTADQSVWTVRNAADLRAIKLQPNKGYNFLACRPGNDFDRDLAALAATRDISESHPGDWKSNVARPPVDARIR